VTRLLLTVFFLETGLVLLFAPWSAFWDRNYFAQGPPILHAMLISDFVRGAVSGIGLLNLVAAVGEVQGFLIARRQTDDIASIAPRRVLEE
jgi:hypothetical protein